MQNALILEVPFVCPRSVLVDVGTAQGRFVYWFFDYIASIGHAMFSRQMYNTNSFVERSLHVEAPSCRVVLLLMCQTFFSFVVFSSGISFAGEFEPMSRVTLPIMEKVANRIQENAESIRTWQGKVHYNRKEPTESWVDNMVIEFYVDRVRDWRSVVSTHIKTEIGGAPQPLGVIGILLMDDLCYVYRGINPDGPIPIPGSDGVRMFSSLEEMDGVDIMPSYLGGHLRTMQRSVFPFSDGNLKDNFDPIYVISHRSKSLPLSVMHNLVEVVRRGDTYKSEILIKSEDNLVEVNWKQPFDRNPNRYIYDLSKGGNCILEELPDNTSEEPALRKVEYANIGGLFVPRKVDYNLRGRIHETMEFVEQKINEPIDESVFTPVFLGARRGDRSSDERTKVFSTITDPSFPEREPIRDLRKQSGFLYRNALAIIGLLLVMTWAFLRYRRWWANPQ